jgi:hypothetical protein
MGDANCWTEILVGLGRIQIVHSVDTPATTAHPRSVHTLTPLRTTPATADVPSAVPTANRPPRPPSSRRTTWFLGPQILPVSRELRFGNPRHAWRPTNIRALPPTVKEPPTSVRRLAATRLRGSAVLGWPGRRYVPGSAGLVRGRLVRHHRVELTADADPVTIDSGAHPLPEVDSPASC